jgi:hypothetical protein
MRGDSILHGQYWASVMPPYVTHVELLSVKGFCHTVEGDAASPAGLIKGQGRCQHLHGLVVNK